VAARRTPPRAAVKPGLSAAAAKLARTIGFRAMPDALDFTLSFHGDRQGRFTPPAYRLYVDTSRADWLTFQHYNDEPHALGPDEVMVPVELSRFRVVKVTPSSHRPVLEAWARRLLARE